MVEPIGMPGSRPMNTRNGTAEKPIYVIDRYYAEPYRKEFEAAGFSLKRYGTFDYNDAVAMSGEEMQLLAERTGLLFGAPYATDRRHVFQVQPTRQPVLPESVQKLFLGPDPLGMSVTLAEWNGSAPDSFAVIASRILAPVLKRRIFMSVPHGHPRTYLQSDTFHIYVWSAPTVLYDVKAVPDKIWGIPTETRDNAMIGRNTRPDFKHAPGIFIMDGDYPVAELLPDALFIHHDLVHYGTPAEFQVFAHLLLKVAEKLAEPKEWEQQIKLAEQTRAEYAAKAEAERKAKEEAALANLIKKSIPVRLQHRRGQLDTLKAQAQELRRQYFNAERTIFSLINEKEQDADVAAKRFVAEIHGMKSGKVEHVTDITVDARGNVVFMTDTIFVTHPRSKKEYELGRFKVSMNLENGQLLNIENLDRTFTQGRTVFHSPHVFYTGGDRVCLGNIQAEVHAYIAHFELEIAVTLIVAFLQSVTPEVDYLNRLEYFPMKETKAGKKAAQAA